MWNGDYKFLLSSLILKDFRIRYRNMSLGVLWALVNPLVMVGVLVLVFTKFLAAPAPDYPIFLICGIVIFNLFSMGWGSGTTSIIDNAGLIKRVAVPRELIPVASVLSVLIHGLIQFGMLIVFAFAFGKYPNLYWLWLPVILFLLISFVIGLGWLFAGMNVYVRDTRYVVESGTAVMFWLVPIIYPHTAIPIQYRGLYLCNPVAAAIVSVRDVVVLGQAPSLGNISKMTIAAAITLTVGLLVFRKLKSHFYNYL
jgi:ABC-type polysaccharide/polyol phosphate export permease